MSVRPVLWRSALVLSAVLASQGGRMHPEADASGTVRSELAEMTSSDTWVSSHTLLLAAGVLLSVGLWGATRSPAFARVRTPLRLAAAASVLAAVENAFHLATVVDSHALGHGGSAPVAMTHVTLSLLLYPVTGAAFAYFSVRLAAGWTGPRRLAAVPGVLGGLVHAAVVPLTLLLPDAETSPLFAAAGLLVALWAVALATLAPTERGLRSTAPARELVDA